MSPGEHYNEAERLLASRQHGYPLASPQKIAAAQAHATLALAGAILAREAGAR